MRVFLAAIVIASLAGSAFAQQKSVPKYGELDGKKPHEIKAEKEAEEAYQRSLGRIPVPEKGSSDPWGSVRSEGAPKAAPSKTVAKDPAAKRAKSEAKADGKSDGAAK
jgi:hypothetical protein